MIEADPCVDYVGLNAPAIEIGRNSPVQREISLVNPVESPGSGTAGALGLEGNAYGTVGFDRQDPIVPAQAVDIFGLEINQSTVDGRGESILDLVTVGGFGPKLPTEIDPALVQNHVITVSRETGPGGAASFRRCRPGAHREEEEENGRQRDESPRQKQPSGAA